MNRYNWKYLSGEFIEDSKTKKSFDMNDCIKELNSLNQDNVKLCEALECVIAVIGLTAFKYESQRSVLQESIDMANTVLKDLKAQREYYE